jgi:hypothetical protein
MLVKQINYPQVITIFIRAINHPFLRVVYDIALPTSTGL